MPDSHIVKAFDQELNTLSSSIGAMGDFAAAQFSDSVRALLTGDLALAERVVDQDRQLDALRRDLSTAAAIVITRRQPMATDLDEVLADFRIVEDLERVGDLAKNIAKRASAVTSSSFPADITQSLQRLADLALDQLKQAMATYVSRDADAALLVRRQDEQVDHLHGAIFREIVARMSADHGEVIGFVHLLFCAKNIERIGDHATHIAEAAYMTATGHPPDEERKRLDTSSSVPSRSAAGRA